MKHYLVYTPNGDIYIRRNDYLMDDLHDHMSQGECKIEGWRYEKHMEDGNPPALVLVGNAAISKWLSEEKFGSNEHLL
jgi:hypothetical protein